MSSAVEATVAMCKTAGVGRWREHSLVEKCKFENGDGDGDEDEDETLLTKWLTKRQHSGWPTNEDGAADTWERVRAQSNAGQSSVSIDRSTVHKESDRLYKGKRINFWTINHFSPVVFAFISSGINQNKNKVM